MITIIQRGKCLFISLHNGMDEFRIGYVRLFGVGSQKL